MIRIIDKNGTIVGSETREKLDRVLHALNATIDDPLVPYGVHPDDAALLAATRTPVPPEITMAQFRYVLRMGGKLDAVERALASLAEPGRAFALDAWERSATLLRAGALATIIVDSGIMSTGEMDEAFVAAEGVKL